MLLSPEKEKPPPRGQGLITVHGHRRPRLYRVAIVTQVHCCASFFQQKLRCIHVITVLQISRGVGGSAPKVYHAKCPRVEHGLPAAFGTFRQPCMIGISAPLIAFRIAISRGRIGVRPNLPDRVVQVRLTSHAQRLTIGGRRPSRLSISTVGKDRYVLVCQRRLGGHCCEAPFGVSRESQGLETRRILGPCFKHCSSSAPGNAQALPQAMLKHAYCLRCTGGAHDLWRA
jgi:hypothetical protein